MRSPLKVRQMLQLDDEIPVNSMGLMCDMDDPDFASQALISTPWNLPDFLRHSHSEVKTWVRQNMKDILAEIKTE
jgi:hypothetical protein